MRRWRSSSGFASDSAPLPALQDALPAVQQQAIAAEPDARPSCRRCRRSLGVPTSEPERSPAPAAARVLVAMTLLDRRCVAFLWAVRSRIQRSPPPSSGTNDRRASLLRSWRSDVQYLGSEGLVNLLGAALDGAGR